MFDVQAPGFQKKQTLALIAPWQQFAQPSGQAVG